MLLPVHFLNFVKKARSQNLVLLGKKKNSKVPFRALQENHLSYALGDSQYASVTF